MKKSKIVFGLVCLLLVIIGFTYANYSGMDLNKAFGKVFRIDEDAYGINHFNSDNLELIPIFDDEVNKNSNNVIYIDFRVGGSNLNDEENIIYDIALVDLEVDCNLLSPYLKWKLIKNNETIDEGSFDYKFDTIKNKRLVLTSIQQDLKPYSEDKFTYDYYQFYIWISDSYQEKDLINSSELVDQSHLMGRKLKGKIEVELYGGTKNELVRKPQEEIDKNTCISEGGDING